MKQVATKIWQVRDVVPHLSAKFSAHVAYSIAALKRLTTTSQAGPGRAPGRMPFVASRALPGLPNWAQRRHNTQDGGVTMAVSDWTEISAALLAALDGQRFYAAQYGELITISGANIMRDDQIIDVLVREEDIRLLWYEHVYYSESRDPVTEVKNDYRP